MCLHAIKLFSHFLNTHSNNIARLNLPDLKFYFVDRKLLLLSTPKFDCNHHLHNCTIVGPYVVSLIAANINNFYIQYPSYTKYVTIIQ